MLSCILSSLWDACSWLALIDIFLVDTISVFVPLFLLNTCDIQQIDIATVNERAYTRMAYMRVYTTQRTY